jgi:hypothetical protein
MLAEVVSAAPSLKEMMNVFFFSSVDFQYEFLKTSFLQSVSYIPLSFLLRGNK